MNDHAQMSAHDAELDSVLGAGGVPKAVDEPDDELMALPAPPKTQRYLAMGVMALVVALSIGLLSSLRADLDYFFASNEVENLGAIADVDVSELASNQYVRIDGNPMASRMVTFSRVLTGGEYVVFPLAGQRSVFVQVPSPDGGLPSHFSRREFSGRLTTFGELGGRYRSVLDHLRSHYGDEVDDASFVLMADEAPGSYSWSLYLAALCLFFIVLNVAMIIRWFRPLPYSMRAHDSDA